MLNGGRLVGRLDYGLPQRRKIRLQFLVSCWSTVELQNVREDVDVGLIVKAAGIILRHRAANLLENLRKAFILPSELENAFCQVRCFRIGAVQVAAMTARTTSLIGALPVFCLLCRKDAGGGGA